MPKAKRVTPYKQRARKGEKSTALKIDKKNPIDALDTSKARSKIEVMTAAELARVQQVAAQNALTLFNELMKELTDRIPAMDDQMLSESLLSVWDKIGVKK